MTGCMRNNTAIIQSLDTETFLREKVQYEPNLGKDYWTRTPWEICSNPFPNTKCEQIAESTKLQLDGIEQGFRGHPYFHVKLIDGRTGYAPASQFGSLADVDPAIIAAECKRRGNPR